jgi:uroporphyrin-III C-methyltransferase
VRDWEAMARTGQPIILYMAMSNLARIADVFLGAGLPADTPVAIIASATYAEERLLETELGRAAQDARDNGIGAPAIVAVGSVVGVRRHLLHALLQGEA